MNWFDASGLTSLAKSALKEAQKTIDKALDIQDDSSEEQEEESSSQSEPKPSPSKGTPQKDNSDFFSSWGLTVSAECDKNAPVKEQPVVTESPSKSTSQSVWGSFAGSFFEQPNADKTIVKPPKAKSMNVIADSQFGSQDDLFSKSQLVMSDSEGVEYKTKKDETPQVEERRGSSRSNVLSLVSSRNSSDSVEVLSQSMKTTPDSEISIHSISQSSSVSQKQNSESVEILPDSLISPSSIECLGFDSYSSDRNSSTSSNLSPGDISDKKSTPIGERTERAETADSVSLVADEDEDTMSYNSISECTAPTVFDTDEKGNIVPKLLKSESRKGMERELIHLEATILPQKLHLCENSSNDGSWSDRTLNADNDSITLDNTNEEDKKDKEPEDTLIDKLSDSSSFYNVNVSSEMLHSDSSAFVNVEKQQCSSQSSISSQKDSVKERTSPISSDSKSSDLVKIGSDRTSGHTSGDEVETATSSDIEIIPSPNGGDGFRNSPAKYGFKNGKFDGSTSPNLVDLVLGKSLATKIRGHTRELSEASVQSNTSDESQGSENERLMRRLCEMAEILDARESRLMEVSRSNADLVESNADLKSQVEALMAKHEVGDINMITEDYTQRMSALEKKFQQAIREKDILRKQLDSLKVECSRKNSSELEASLKEKEEMVGQLQEEGEKLAKQQLQQSNIIKKLRAKDKDNEQVIKGLRDKIAELTAESDRLKRSVAAKEELEVSQIEAVYRLTTQNKKMETELLETKSALDDATNNLETCRTSLEGARRELATRRDADAQLARAAARADTLQQDLARAEHDLQVAQEQLAQLRHDHANEERRWVSRAESLRLELDEARAALAGAEWGAPPPGAPPAAVLTQLAHLQEAALHRERAHARQIAELEKSLAVCAERERVSREECITLQQTLKEAGEEAAISDKLREELTRAQNELAAAQERIHGLSSELEAVRTSKETELQELRTKVDELERQLDAERTALEVERKRNSILQEQLSCRGEVSPPQSVVSDSLSMTWPSEDVFPGNSSGSMGGGAGGGGSALLVDDVVSALSRRDGELRALRRQRDTLRHERDSLAAHVAQLHHRLDHHQSVQEQYDALLQMYGEKEEQLGELRLDLHDVTQLYKQQLDELLALRDNQR